MTNQSTPTAGTDAALAARLERLAASRNPSPAPSSSTSPTSGAKGRGGGSASGRRKHPSKGSRAASLALSLATTGALSYAFALNASSAAASGTVSSAAPAASTAAATSAGAATGAATSSAATASATTAVTGSADSNRWGVVQVEAVFDSSGSLTAVNVLQTPNSDGRSVSINAQATPILTSEALTGQSAKVDTVSGATYTSNSYARSLQAAIDSARASGVTTTVA